MPSSRPLPLLLCALALAAAGATGCGDDGPTTTSASTVPDALAAQGDRGGSATVPTQTGPRITEYVDTRKATAAEAAPVRAGFKAFADAFVERDAAAACSHAVGFEELLRARGQSGTCEALLPGLGNTSAGPSPRDVALIEDADVEIGGDRATISVGGESPVPMRRVDGSWKLDYAAFAATPKDR
ncbi:hypothetical protein [Patulibacter minatonensis]|uniref:hypothetical protein n=1 Tax=Patulibacter minatonensis TaxID=298163 RepID=UPI00047CFBDD|nr:hypothetical protein [Patulibacter minatonensis]